jgi:hypothetical protein
VSTVTHSAADRGAHGTPECRHLLTVRGGTLACTKDAGHPDKRHEDAEMTDEQGRHAAWECKDAGTPPNTGPSVCLSFTGYRIEEYVEPSPMPGGEPTRIVSITVPENLPTQAMPAAPPRHRVDNGWDDGWDEKEEP